MKILVFDKYLGYQIGGAQNSLHSLLRELRGDFKFIGCEVKKSFSAEKYKLEDWTVERMKIKEFPKFPYFEYWFNRKKIKKYIAGQKADLLITQGLWGALAVDSFSNKKVYYLRDEYQLNRVFVYQRGIKKIFKLIYLLIQGPFIWLAFRDNKRAIKNTDLVIANSNFVKIEAEKIFNVKCELVYSIINIDFFRKGVLDGGNNNFIVCIGSEIIKGLRVVQKIAQKMKNHKFMIVGRQFKSPIWKNNILYQPWINNVADIYKQTKILLIPSLINDSRPRVLIEAMNFGIPCIGSNRGGIPEVLDREMIINDVWDIEAWKNKILEVEKNYNEYTNGLENVVKKFDKGIQIEKFRKIVKDKLGIDL